MQVAILQEAVASDSVDFTPKEKAGAIMKRMAAFGFVAGSNNQHMKDMVTAAAVSVTQNAKTLDALCTFYGAEADVRGIDPKSVMRSDVQAKRDKNAEVIRSQLGELGANKSFAIRYGAFGDVVVSLPVFVGVSVSGETRVQRDNAITISHEEVAGKARFTLKLVGGASVRQGVSVSAMADLLAVKGFVHRASDQGYSFSFDDRQACMDLALALANGDAADPRLWTGSRIQSEQSASKGMGGSVNASLDLGVIAFEAQAQIQGSREVAVQQSMFGRSETYGRHFEATATASATLAGEMGAKDVARGIDRTVSRTLQTQLGMFTKDSRAIVSAKVINGNVDHCLKYVLPPALAGQADAFKAQLDGIEDGTQVFVRCRLDPKVRESANKLLVQAEKTLLDASLFSGDDATRTRRRDAARKEAQELVVRAYAMTAKPEAYLPEGLGWTTKAQVEVTSSRKAFEYFASSEALETRFVPFDTPAGLLRADVEL